MDLRNLMNDDDKGQSQANEPRTAATAPAPIHTNAQPSTPSRYGQTSQHQPALYPPPSAGGIAAHPSQSHGMTPLRTPSQTTAASQYPFPQQTQQSPIGAAPGQHFRPFESQPSAIPARPGSRGHPYQTAQPGAYSGQTPIQQQNSYTSISPTPPSHLSRTPSSLRQSPMATMSHLPGQQHQQFSQPNTPLGPPQHYPQRPPPLHEAQSPYHQRSFSNASNGLVSGSPAQHHPGIPNLVESPSAYARPSPQTAHSRRPSEYKSQSQSQRTSRERSISVSPKTRPPPRPPSIGSRQSSNAQEMYSGRASEQYSNAPLPGSPHHVTQAQSQPQPRFSGYPNAASEVPQATPPSLQPAPSMFPPATQSSLSSQTGSQAPPPQPTNISHQSEKMGMSHLVTPASEVPPQANGNSMSQLSAAAKPKEAENVVANKERSATPKSWTPHPPQPAQNHSNHMNQMEAASNDQQMTDAGDNGKLTAANNDGEARTSHKRPASSSNSLDEPPKKQLKAATSRKYTERPIWARLSKHNPKFDKLGHTNGAPNSRPPPSRMNGAPPAKGGPVVSQSSASSAPSGSEPIDTDILRIKSFLGDWERSFTNRQPLPDTKRTVADWIFTQLAQLRDVGTDPHYGTVEIEGKVGTLVKKDTGDRCSLPVMNTVILNPAMSEQYRFESRMQESEHAHMNKTLNTALQESRGDGRVMMRYEHFMDVDSFHPLSATGLKALPPAIRARVERGRPPRLRTTVRHEKGRSPYVAARIVKVNVGNLHVFSPNDPYDLRISVNVEVNLDRPDLHPDDLTTPATSDKEEMPERRKDRISYSHLAYQIDLTRVDVGSGGKEGPKPIYELEIEVETPLLRAQMAIAESGRDCAFGDVVEGFWDNAVLLMRERAR